MAEKPGLRLEAFLRTPRGTLALLGASLAFSGAVAVGVASQRTWFESRVREAHPAPTAEIEALGRQLTVVDRANAERVRDLPPDERRRLYSDWLQAGSDWPAAAPGVMVTADPEFYLDRAFQTLAAGSPEQRARAAEFLGRSGSARARGLLEEAQARARRRRESDLEERISVELSRLARRPARGSS